MSQAGESERVVLRIEAGETEWLAAARARWREAPDALTPLFDGRSRVELSRAEAESALAWARGLPGWNDDARPPLFIYCSAELLLRS